MTRTARTCAIALGLGLVAGCGDVERDDPFATGYDGEGIVFGDTDDGDADDDAPAADPGADGGSDGGDAGTDGDDPGADPTGRDDGGRDDGGTTGGDDPAAADVPDNAYCADVADWDDAWVQQELQMLDLVNELRAQALTCADGGAVFGPSEPLQLDPALRCAARVHVEDMVDNDFFSHTGSDGSSYQDRAFAAGYPGLVAEDLGDGYTSPAAAVAGWLHSPGHCIYMLGAYQYAGVAHRTGTRRSWGLVMGK